MSDINKRIHENAAALAKVKAGSCECGGVALICLDCWHPDLEDGYTREETCGDCQSPHPTPCPACTMLRKIAEYHWHEWIVRPKKDISSRYSCTCGLVGYDGRDADNHIAESNPIYTVQTLRTLLVELGEWEGFKDDLFASLLQKILGTIDYRVAEAMKKFADILTSDLLMRQAVDAYLEHRVGEVA